MTQTYIAAPDDPNDTVEYRRILEDLRATDADNDNEPASRRAHSTSPRHRAWQEAFAPLMDWSRLREASESGPVGSNWMLAPGDSAAPKKVEAGKPNWFLETDLIMAASRGVRWKQVGGRLVPADGLLKYDARGRLIQCGRLIIASDPIAANDDEPLPPPKADNDDTVEIVGGIKRPTERIEEVDDPDDQADSVADIFGRALGSGEDIDRGRRHGDKVRVGEIVGILHRTAKSDKFVVLKEPRNAEGRYRMQKRRKPGVKPNPPRMPPPAYTISPDDQIDSRALMQRLIPLMSSDAVTVLDYALRASNLADIGEVFGKSGKHAERVGRQKLTDACAEFEAAMQRIEEQDAARQQALAA